MVQWTSCQWEEHGLTFDFDGFHWCSLVVDNDLYSNYAHCDRSYFERNHCNCEEKQWTRKSSRVAHWLFDWAKCENGPDRSSCQVIDWFVDETDWGTRTRRIWWWMDGNGGALMSRLWWRELARVRGHFREELYPIEVDHFDAMYCQGRRTLWDDACRPPRRHDRRTHECHSPNFQSCVVIVVE